MKFNWGTGIVLAFVGFISFILYFVITMNVDDSYNHDLVTKEYYQKELKFQEEIDALERAKKLGMVLVVKQTSSGLLVSFPENLQHKKVSGTVFLYRPSNKQLDFEIPISLSNPYLLIPNKRLLDGRWNIAIQWEYDNKQFLTKKELMF